jgi:hypothetical protein
MIGFMFRYLFSIPKLNREPEQHELARLFIDCTEGRQPWEAVADLVASRQWSRDERELRITHALSLVKLNRRDLYREASLHGRALMYAARQVKDTKKMPGNLSFDQKEKIAEEVVNLIRKRGVRTYHTLIEVLATTIIGMVKQMPPGNEKELTKKSMIEMIGSLQKL